MLMVSFNGSAAGEKIPPVATLLARAGCLE
jgi:hypothetical protein